VNQHYQNIYQYKNYSIIKNVPLDMSIRLILKYVGDVKNKLETRNCTPALAYGAKYPRGKNATQHELPLFVLCAVDMMPQRTKDQSLSRCLYVKSESRGRFYQKSLRAAFTRKDPKSVKRQSSCQLFSIFGICVRKSYW